MVKKTKRAKRYVGQVSVVFSRDLREWQVKAYDQHGSRMAKSDYFSDDEDDAITTAAEMLRNGKSRK